MLDDRDKWDRLARHWYDAGPPSTPSREDLRIYADLLDAEAPTVVTVLGCTPSLRKLIRGREQVQLIVLVDFSTRMHRVTTRLIGPSAKEAFLLGDWCEGWRSPAASQMIVADRALDNVPLGRRTAFFAAVRRQLTASGCFVCHTAVVEGGPQDVSVGSLHERWRAEWHTGQPLSDCVDGLWDDLLSIASRAEPAGVVLSMSYVWSELEHLARGPAGSPLLQQLLKRYRPSRDAFWYSSTTEQVATAAQDVLTLDAVRRAGDYRAAQHHPFLIFRPHR